MPERIWVNPADQQQYSFSDRVSDDQIKAFIHQKSAPPAAPDKSTGFISNILSNFGATVAQGATAAKELPKDTKDALTVKNAASFARPLDIAAALAVARTTASVTPGPPSIKALTGTGAGVAALLGADSYVQRLMGRDPTVMDTAISLGINELGGKALGFVGKKAKAIWKSIGQESDLPQQLGATAAQRAQSPVMKVIEDVFAGKNKQEALDASGKLAKAKGAQTVSELSGQPQEIINDPNAFAAVIKKDVAGNYRRSQLTSNGLATIAESIGHKNPSNVLVGYEPTGNMLLGTPTTQPVYQTVHGPIPVGDAYMWAKKALKEHPDPSLLVSEGEKKVYAVARDIVGKSEVLSSDGKVVATRPISFRDAWDAKQVADKFRAKDPRFATLADSFNKDIEAGISNWKDGGPSALKAWNASKAEVKRRIDVFNSDDSIAKMLESNNTVVPEVSDAIKDPERLKRLLLTQSGKGQGNIRKLAQGYDLQEVLQNSFDPASGTFNPNKISDAWLDPAKQASRKILYSQEQQKSIDTVLNAIKQVSTPESNIGKVSTNFRIVNSGIGFGAALLSGADLMSFRGMSGATILGGFMSLKYLGKVATNPKYAPLIANLIKGEPLGMSGQLASRLIFNAFAGAPLDVKLSNGETKTGTILQGGKIDFGEK